MSLFNLGFRYNQIMSTLADQYLREKWSNMDSYLKDKCCFCDDCKCYCKQCYIPAIICRMDTRWNLQGLGRSLSDNINPQLWELPDWYITLFQDALKDIVKNGFLSNEMENKIKEEIKREYEKNDNEKTDC